MIKQKINCNECSSADVIKKGLKKNKLKTKQRYLCKNCRKIFTLKQEKEQYPLNTVLTSVSLYNLGYSFNETAKLTNKKFKTSISQKTISNWYNNYVQHAPYHKIREQCKKLCNPDTIIEKYIFMHNNLPYQFQVHKAKLYLLFHSIKYNNQFHNISHFYEPIKNYLENIPTNNFPHHIFKEHKSFNSAIANNEKITIFSSIKSISYFLYNKNKINNRLNNKNPSEQRASQLKLGTLKIKKLAKNNLANKLTKLALNLAKSNKQRHEAIQNFFLINDSTTIATEIPVYLTNDDLVYFLSKGFSINPKNYETPITGHIDILQIRNGLVHILDYKPDANKINPIEQLTIYALALASRTKLALSDFKAAWFDENNYFEFYPLHTVYTKKENEQKMVNKLEIRDKIYV
ncbi:MAG: hypothetical protein IH934_07590 [Nanoarchaeota archaeon]|nr:hypothetical protein [Nanoarchaeota archaeon]